MNAGLAAVLDRLNHRFPSLLVDTIDDVLALAFEGVDVPGVPVEAALTPS